MREAVAFYLLQEISSCPESAGHVHWLTIGGCTLKDIGCEPVTQHHHLQDIRNDMNWEFSPSHLRVLIFVPGDESISTLAERTALTIRQDSFLKIFALTWELRVHMWVFTANPLMQDTKEWVRFVIAYHRCFTENDVSPLADIGLLVYLGRQFWNSWTLKFVAFGVVWCRLENVWFYCKNIILRFVHSAEFWGLVSFCWWRAKCSSKDNELKLIIACKHTCTC